jgi:hypothetical protein
VTRPVPWPWICALVLCVAQAALLTDLAWSTSDTYDEHVYIRAGALQIRHHDLSMAPVPAWGFGLALWISGELDEIAPRLEQSSEAYLFDGSSPAIRLRMARVATIILTVLAGLALWRAASRSGELAGAVVHAVWCFSPLTLAHGSLATLDAWVAGWLAISILTTLRYAEGGQRRWIVLSGVAAAFACASKVTALGALPIFAVVALYRHDKRAVLWFVLAFLVALWASCGFEIGTLEFSRPGFAVEVPNVPFPSWLRQIVAQSHHGFVGGHNVYLDGTVTREGRWSFYLWALALQVPLAAWGLFLLALLLAPRRWRRGEWRADLFLLAYPLVLFVVLSAARTQLGLRYLLPALPFVLLWIGRSVGDAPALPAAVLAAAVVATGIRAQPHQLAYFNPLAGTQWQALHRMVEGVDWCQGKIELAQWLRKRRPDNLLYSGCGTQPEPWGIRATPIKCDGRPFGTWVLHADQAFRTLVDKPDCVDWLLVRPPDQIIGETIFVYEVLPR